MTNTEKNKIIKYDFLKTDKTGISIVIRLIPNSSKDAIIGYTEEYLKIKLTAQAIENKANKQLIIFLSKQFHIPKTNFSFLSGEKSKLKRIHIEGLLLEDICGKISVYDKIDS